MSNLAFLILSVQSSDLSFTENNARMREAFDALSSNRIDFACISELVNGVSSPVFFIYDSSDMLDYIIEVADLFGQDSVLYCSSEGDASRITIKTRTKDPIGKVKVLSRFDVQGMEYCLELPQGDQSKGYLTFR